MKKLLLLVVCSFVSVFAEDVDVVCYPVTIMSSFVTRQEYDIDMLEINFGIKDEFDCPVPSPSPLPESDRCPVPTPSPTPTEGN